MLPYTALWKTSLNERKDFERLVPKFINIQTP